MAGAEFDYDASFTVSTGGGEELYIRQRRDEFFARTLGHLGLATDSPFVTIQEQVLGLENPDGFHPSDDKWHQLLVQDELLAGVLDRRDGHNRHQVHFLSQPPGPRTMILLRRLRNRS